MTKKWPGRRLLALLLAVCLLPLPARAAADGLIIASRNMVGGALSLKVGEMEQLSVTKDGSNIDDTWILDWSSANEEVATVSPNGLVSAVGAGMATISVKAYQGENDETPDELSCQVTVIQPTVASIVLSKSDLTLDVKQSEVLTASIQMQPEDAEKETVTWSSADESVAAVVSETGKVTGMSPGQTTITATAGGKFAACTVTVTGLLINPKEMELAVGGSATIERNPYNISSLITYEFRSGNELVARVDSNGRVTAVGPGQCSVTVSTSDGRFSEVCQVTVKENTANVITEKLNAGQPLSLSDLAGEIDSQCRSLLGSRLSYVTSLSVDSTSQGILYYGYVSVDDTGSGVGSQEKFYYGSVASGRLSLDNVTFVAKSDFSGTAVITYTGYNADNQFFSGSIRVTVEETEDVTYSTGVNTPVTFSSADFSAACRSQNGRDARSVTFTLPSSRYGTLYYNYTGAGQLSAPVESGASYFVSNNPYLDKVTFVPAKDYTGTVRVAYSGRDTANNTFSGRITIYVSGSSGGSGDIRYKTGAGQAIDFGVSDFNSLCRDITGYNMDYVRFTLPASSRGTLYYDYTSANNYDSRVAESSRYYRSGSPALSRVTFVPKSGYSGTVEIDFSGYDVEGNRFSGTVEITVGDAGGVVSYQTVQDKAVSFSASDFNSVCTDALGSNLSYVRFDLPASTRGTLYYDYTSASNYGSRVTNTDKYYRNSSPQLSWVTFVPATGYTGTVEIGFTGYGQGGGSFSGRVEIQVGRGTGKVTELHYDILSGGVFTVDPSDFNTVCREKTDDALSYVRFTLPAASSGALYYNYKENGSYDSKVTASTSYYRTGGSRLMSRVAFVPADGFAGTVELSYTGWSTRGEEFDGVVRVTVTSPVANTVHYTTGSGAAAFRGEDFNSACRQLMNRDLSWVRFTPPSSSVGRLYYNYAGPGRYGAEVRSSVNYYYDGLSPVLSRVSFVPKAGFQGAASIAYVAEDTAGNSYSGTVEVWVSTSGGSTSFRDMGSYSWAVGAVEFLHQNGVVNGVGANQYGPGRSISRGDFVLMLCKAFGLDTGSAASFSDVPADSYYAQAVATAKDLGITQGSGENRFYPQGAVNRQDAVVMLQKAMQAAGWSISNGAESTLAGYQDREDVAGYARGAVAAMVELGIIQGDSSGRLNPRKDLTRAEMAVILHQALTL